MRRLSLLGCLLLSSRLASAAPAAPQPKSEAAAKVAPAANVPTVFTTALPARVAFIAWLPAGKTPDLADQIDLDLRVEVVLPASCGDKVAGLLRRGAMKPDGADTYEAVIEVHEVGECKKEATRIGARTAIRMRLPEGLSRELSIGALTLRVTRAGKKVTIDGNESEGDVPGAPPTARPSVLVMGEVASAKLVSAEPVTSDARPARVARADVSVTAKWMSCAGPPLGFLASGDAQTHYALTRFSPLARLPLDEACKGTVTRTVTLPAIVHLAKKGEERPIRVGTVELGLKLGQAAAKK